MEHRLVTAPADRGAARAYGDRLRQARVRAGRTQADLAADIGCTQATVSAYESGARRPPAAVEAALDAALGERVAYALTPGPAGGRPARRGRGVQALPDAEAVARYQLMRRLEAGRLRAGERPPTARQLREWRRSDWMQDAVRRGVLPPGPELGGELGDAG
jgi:transcriptional regulator with XRE-family HTH domain